MPARPRRHDRRRRAARASSSSTTRTTRRRPCTALKTVTDFVERVRRISPDTVILIDEAYHDYVTDPAYQTAIPLALATPNVFVARTFSKAYGMAGMRIGYAIGQADTVKPLARLQDAVQRQRVRRRRGDRVARRSEAHRGRARAQHRGARLHRQGARGPRLQADRLAGQLHLRGHRTAGDGLPRRLRQARASWSAATSRRSRARTCRISIGTMEEMQKADGTCSASVLRPIAPAAGGPSPAADDRRASHADTTQIRSDRGSRRGRRVTRAPGSARAAARTASGRRSSRRCRRSSRGVICLSSNENPVGPGKTVLDAVKAAFGPNGATPGRYSSQSGALIEAIAKKFTASSRRTSCSAAARRRSSARRRTCSPRRPRRSSARFRPTRNAPATRT